MTTVTATEARKQLYKLLDDVSDSHEPVRSPASAAMPFWSGRMTGAPFRRPVLVSIPGMRESIIEGMATPPEELDGELHW